MAVQQTMADLKEKIVISFQQPAKYYGINKNLSNHRVTFKPGITCIVGPTGHGKTTMIKQVAAFCHRRQGQVVYTHFNNFIDADIKRQTMSMSAKHYSTTGTVCGMEFDPSTASYTYYDGHVAGEAKLVVKNLYNFLTTGTLFSLTKSDWKKPAICLLDCCDDGLSLDGQIMVRRAFDDLVDICRGVAYVIFASNNFEIIRGHRCIDAKSGRDIEFHTYDDFHSYIVRKSEMKEEIRAYEKEKTGKDPTRAKPARIEPEIGAQNKK